MGRPLANRYFGNENTNDSGDNQTNFGTVPGGATPSGGATAKSGEGIGGDSVASVTINTVGAYTSRLPTITFSDPNLAGVGAVTATGDVHGKVVSAAVTANGTGYNFGDVLAITGGTYDTQGSVTVTEVLVVGTPVKSAGGTGFADGDLLTFSGAGWSQNLILRVNRPGGGTGSPDNFTVNQIGRRTAAVPTNPVAYTSRTGSGSGCTVTITWGVYSTGTVSEPGDYTVVASGARATTSTPSSGRSGATVTVNYGVKNIVITDPGSGYTTVADAVPAFSAAGGGEILAEGTSVLTVDSGTPWTRDAFNTLIVYGQTTDAGSNLMGDIIKQENTRRYKIRTANGTAYCNLKAGTPSANGEMSMTATDSNNATYYVTKLTAHKATLTPYGGGTHLFPLVGDATDQQQSIHWTLTTSDDSYDSDTTVIVANS